MKTLSISETLEELRPSPLHQPIPDLKLQLKPKIYHDQILPHHPRSRVLGDCYPLPNPSLQISSIQSSSSVSEDFVDHGWYAVVWDPGLMEPWKAIGDVSARRLRRPALRQEKNISPVLAGKEYGDDEDERSVEIPSSDNLHGVCIIIFYISIRDNIDFPSHQPALIYPPSPCSELKMNLVGSHGVCPIIKRAEHPGGRVPSPTRWAPGFPCARHCYTWLAADPRADETLRRLCRSLAPESTIGEDR